MHTMSRDEWHEFVTAGGRTGKLAVVRADGSPHVVPIWFVLDTVGDQDYVIFNTGDGLKTIDAMAPTSGPTVTIEPSYDAFEAALNEVSPGLLD